MMAASVKKKPVKPKRKPIKKSPAKKAKRTITKTDRPLHGMVWDAITRAAKKKQALRIDELATLLKKPIVKVAETVHELSGMGLVRVEGRDIVGDCWAPVPTEGRPLFGNPAPGATALKKAKAWYQKESLVDGVQTIRLPHTVEAVKIGKLISLTYESEKYDGRKRLWKHDVTGDKDLHISADGKVLVVLPGFVVTSQGIKG